MPEPIDLHSLDTSALASNPYVWIGYLIGLYEGEGTCQTSKKPNNPWASSRLNIRMTDKEPLEYLAAHFGGRFFGPYLSPSDAAKGYKPKYRWTAGRVDDFEALTRLMMPLLSPRRQGQIQKALDLLRPAMAVPVAPGSRRECRPGPQRARRSGELVCPANVEPSARGYQRHRLLGIPACKTCRESANLYQRIRNASWYKDRTAEIQRNNYLSHQEERIQQAREYRAKNRKPLTEPVSDDQ